MWLYFTTVFFVLYLVLLLRPSSSFVASKSIKRKGLSSFKTRSWLFLPEGFTRPVDKNGKVVFKKLDKPKPIHNIDELKQMIAEGYRVRDLDVRGDIASLLNTTTEIHPVVKELYKRKLSKSLPGYRTDGNRIAISVEGGGMRGCVAAGMMTVMTFQYIAYSHSCNDLGYDLYI